VKEIAVDNAITNISTAQERSPEIWLNLDLSDLRSLPVGIRDTSVHSIVADDGSGSRVLGSGEIVRASDVWIWPGFRRM
jgi:hypothetical protein